MITFDLHKTFVSHGKRVGIQLKAEWEQGKIMALYGKSGVGKSSLLRMLAGLMKPDSGVISIDHEIWYDSSKKINIKANKRNVGFLFQDYSLFPNMNILKNIRYGVEDKNDHELVERIIDIADLSDLLKRMPASLSGGQQQRVALARAIVRKPKLLLLDEPLSALDPEMRIKLQEEILAFQEIVNTSILFVSHDLPEVFKLSDEVLIMENGSFSQRGTASDIFVKGTQTIDTIGEVLAVTKTSDQTSMAIMIDGKVVSVNLPDNTIS
ncbi:MAG: ABC transporter ATP-binding protein [Reichenbachiella sp.]|uniref:ABC transporter ATP-binding protein n=1 Tax=Reichenbachiella sp. TaxID=2184521 RepID=UPI003263CE68